MSINNKSLFSRLNFAVANSRIKPSKHITFGIALKRLTNSKNIINIVNIYGYCCSYTIIEELETKMTFVSSNSRQISPEDIVYQPNLLTRVAFDNFDKFVYIAGKDTLHDTVGIIFQNIDMNVSNASETS